MIGNNDIHSSSGSKSTIKAKTHKTIVVHIFSREDQNLKMQKRQISILGFQTLSDPQTHLHKLVQLSKVRFRIFP